MVVERRLGINLKRGRRPLHSSRIYVNNVSSLRICRQADDDTYKCIASLLASYRDRHGISRVAAALASRRHSL